MIILSVDPGKSGAIVVTDYLLGLHNVKIQSHVMPLLKNGKDYDIRQIRDVILNSGAELILVEDVHSVHGSSSAGNFAFGFGVGLIRGMIEISNIPYQLVAPKTWQKEAWVGINKVKDAKLNSQAAVHRLFPGVNLKATARSVKDHDGIIDALLIGYYGYLRFNKK
jgi:hypothetical protein